MCRVAIGPKTDKMRGIKHNKPERRILKGYISEITDHIRMFF